MGARILLKGLEGKELRRRFLRLVKKETGRKGFCLTRAHSIRAHRASAISIGSDKVRLLVAAGGARNDMGARGEEARVVGVEVCGNQSHWSIGRSGR